jgi:putative nucleotidyltransferase with HDIG domain
MVASAVQEPRTAFSAVPLEGLAGNVPLDFPLYLETGQHTRVLYRDVRTGLGEEHIGRLQAEGVKALFVREQDRQRYFHRVETALDSILRNRTVPLERRADVLHGVAIQMAEEVLVTPPDKEGIRRARKVMMATSSLLLRETQGFQAVRRILNAGADLATHSLTVGFFAMGLARHVLGAEPNLLLLAGLAGLLHDTGKVGHEHDGHDPEHTRRGFDQLRNLGLPLPVCEAALYHHERWDGSGFPRGLAGERIPELARLVGIANTFDKVYSGQQPRVGVYDALRILAQAYRGCFEERFALGLVNLFKG